MAGNLTLSQEFGTVLTSTWPDIRAKLYDNITARIPTVHWYYEQQQIEEVSGGAALDRTIVKELPAVTGFAGTSNVTPNLLDPTTRIRYEWKGLVVPWKVPYDEVLKNNGNKIFDLVGMLAEVSEMGLLEGVGGSARGIFSNADETDLTRISGFQGALSPTQTTTGTVGRLNRSNAYWRQQVGTAITSFATNGRSRWQNLLLNVCRGDERTSAIITTLTQYDNFLNAFTGTISFNQPLVATADRFDFGVPEVYFFGAKVFYDAGVPASTAYFVNSLYSKLVVHSEANLQRLDAMSMLAGGNELSVATGVIWYGNLVFTNLARQGVITGGDTV